MTLTSLLKQKRSKGGRERREERRRREGKGKEERREAERRERGEDRRGEERENKKRKEESQDQLISPMFQSLWKLPKFARRRPAPIWNPIRGRAAPARVTPSRRRKPIRLALSPNPSRTRVQRRSELFQPVRTPRTRPKFGDPPPPSPRSLDFVQWLLPIRRAPMSIFTLENCLLEGDGGGEGRGVRSLASLTSSAIARFRLVQSGGSDCS